jgi:hypothetical protein
VLLESKYGRQASHTDPSEHEQAWEHRDPSHVRPGAQSPSALQVLPSMPAQQASGEVAEQEGFVWHAWHAYFSTT